MTDDYGRHAAGLSSPAEHAAAITPDDENNLANSTRGIYVGTAGDLKITTVGGETVTLANVAAGVIHPWRIKRVFSTDTTASDLVAVW